MADVSSSPLEIEAQGTSKQTTQLLAKFLPAALRGTFAPYADNLSELKFNRLEPLGAADGCRWYIGIHGWGEPDAVYLWLTHADGRYLSPAELSALQDKLSKRAGEVAVRLVKIGPPTR